MSLQKRIQEIAECDLTFLDSFWDPALLGFVERGNGQQRHKKACYGYQGMKALLKSKHMTPEQMYAHINNQFNSFSFKETPLVLKRYKRIPLWDLIRENNYPLWESMNKAILGLGFIGWQCTGVVYNKILCSDIVQANQSTNNDNVLLDSAQATALLEDHIIPLDLGEHTPWFLTPVK